MNILTCTLCPNGCVIPDGRKGLCKNRINLGGELYTLTYGKPCAIHVDPIEKKPLYHFLPGSGSFSIATAGCCLSCKYCQNWQISQAHPEDAHNHDLPPEAVVRAALKTQSRSIAYTYTEPTIFYEYMIDTGRLAHEAGIDNVYVTCGFINQEPLDELCDVIDSANVDLKGFSESFYRTITGGQLKPVKEAIVTMYKRGVIVEITNLVVPTVNDDIGEIRAMCEWIRDEVSPEVPLHFARFYPQYKLSNLPPTPLSTLEAAWNSAKDVGLHYVYIGNVPHAAGQETRCPECNTLVLKRQGYRLVHNSITGGACPQCGRAIYGKWL